MAEISWSRFGIGKRFEHADLEHVNKKWFADIFDYQKEAKTFLAQGRGLLISGPPGIGKTYALCALMKDLRAKLGSKFDFQFITAPAILDAHGLLDSKTAVDKHRNDQSWWKTVEQVRSLAINDLGKEDRSRPWLQESATAKLGRILRARHEEQLPVFITTNINLQAPKNVKLAPTFESTYGSAIWSLLYDMTVFRSEIVAPDLRKNETDTDE